MASEMSIDLGQLQDLVTEVQKTRKTRTIHLTEDVVAVVQPARHIERANQHVQKPTQNKGRKTYTLASAYGAVADTGGPRDFDQMIKEAKDERADRLLTSL